MKKQLLRALSLLLTSLLGLHLSSCSKQDDQLLLSPQDQEAGLPSNILTDQEATTQALNIYGALFGEELKASKPLEVQNIQRSSTLRSSDETQQLRNGVLVVNFKDNGGYIIMSEDKHNEPIIAACGKGNFDISAPIENMNLIPILANTDAILDANHRRRYDDIGVKKDIEVEPGMYDNRYEYGPWEIVDQAGPLVPVKWHQWAPHNRKLAQINGQYPPVGCVATAISQIMSYHRRPQYNWDLIISNIGNNYSEEILSTLHRDLGLPHNLNMQYGPGGSGAFDKNVPRTLRAYGYQSSDPCDYNWETIKSEIYTKRPVYISAQYLKVVTITPRFLFWGGKTSITYDKGHAWVLDGIRTLKRKVTMIDGYTKEVGRISYETKELVHCNLGWGGRNDGFYLSKAFNAAKGPEEMRCSGKTTIHGEEDNYQYNHKIIKDIKPL